MERPHDAIALFDLDGTLADFDGALRDQLRPLRHPVEEAESADVYTDEATPYIYARRRLITWQPGFWRSLPRLSLGFDVLNVARELNFEIHVLTKGPKAKPIAWQEKVEWVAEHVPDAATTITQKKSLVYGKVLVDDWPDYFLPWLEVRPRGLVVCVAHPWNSSISHANVIRYDGTNLNEVNEAMTRARASAT